MSKISIVVPVYNGEKYIERCIESLENNELKNFFEIIIVNDGSIDKTKDIIENMMLKYNNIIFLNLEKNKGVSNARNFGIKQSNSDYICFCDADDAYEKNTVDSVINKCESTKYDLLIFDRVDVKNDKTIAYYNCQHNLENINQYIYGIFPSGKVTWSVINKVYRLDIIKKNKLIFDNIKMSEDLAFNLNYNKYVKSIAYIKNARYIRYCNNGSAVYHFNDNFFFDNYLSLIKCNNDIDTTIEEKIIMSLSYVTIYRILDGIDCNNYIEFKKIIKKLKNFLEKKEIKLEKRKGIANRILYFTFNTKQYFLMYLLLNKLRGLKKKYHEN